MARKPGVRVVNGYWYSAAGGVGRYFGKCQDVTQAQAMARLWVALADRELDRVVGVLDKQSRLTSPCRKRTNERTTSGDEPPDELVSSFPTTQQQHPTLSSPTVAELSTLFLSWVDYHREIRTHKERARHLARFNDACGEREARAVGGTHLDAFRDSLRSDGFAPEYVRKHEVSVRACFRWGVKHGHLPKGFTPFATVEPIRVPNKPLLENDLPTPEEVRAILTHAKGVMQDILAVYHATGARTHELIEARVGDYQPHARQLVLGKHKRSKTLRDPIPRTITLNGEADAILKRRCQGRDRDAPLFANGVGQAMTGWEIARRFVTVRKHAGGIRPEITIYSFRHLWISEALMAGLDALLVARMAGTSVKMIETTYGHFKAQAFQDAQARLDQARLR